MELVEALVGGAFPDSFWGEYSVYRLNIFLFYFLSFFVSRIIYIVIITLISVPMGGALHSNSVSPKLFCFSLEMVWPRGYPQTMGDNSAGLSAPSHNEASYGSSAKGTDSKNRQQPLLRLLEDPHED